MELYLGIIRDLGFPIVVSVLLLAFIRNIWSNAVARQQEKLDEILIELGRIREALELLHKVYTEAHEQWSEIATIVDTINRTWQYLLVRHDRKF